MYNHMKLPSLFVAFFALATPWAAFPQTTVFSDTFGSSTLNPTPASPGTHTATTTAYEIASAKTATGTTLSSGALTLSTSATSSGFTEAQAIFTTTPITLSTAGQYIEVYFTFTDPANVLNGTAGADTGLYLGLFNSGGSGPTNGTALWSGGVSSGSTTADTGGSLGWLGYNGNIVFSTSTTAESCAVAIRPSQATVANNLNQEILYPSQYSGSSNVKTLAGVLSQPTLTVGNVYTVALQITYASATTISVAETLYNGAGLGGSIFSSGGFTASYTGTSTTAQDITTTFDALGVGYRAGTSPSVATTLPINNITVIDYIPSAPTITGLTNETVVAGTSPTLNPTVGGTPSPAVQWQTNGVNITGATNSSLVLNNVQYAQSGLVYSLIASNFVNIVTNSMTLNVVVTPAITGLGNQAGLTGSTIVINPTVTGLPMPGLQWQTNGVNVTDGMDANGSTITGSTTSSLSIANAQAADSGTYSLIASNSAGMVTNSMILTVSSGNVLPSITGPSNQTVIQGNNATFSAVVSGLPVPTVQWLDQTGTPINGATNATLTLTNVQYSQNGYVYSLEATNAVGTITNGATLMVIVSPAITTQPVSLVATNTQSASFTIAATGVPSPAYQWFKNGSVISSASNPSATSAVLTIASVAPADAATYYAQISNSAGTTNGASVILTVNSAMTVTSLMPVNGATGICYDTPLSIAFSEAPTLETNGTIKIFNVTNSITPVDTINLALNVTFDSSSRNVQGRLIAGETFTNYPVIITGNQAAIYPHLDMLTSNQTYYVTVDNGTFADPAGANFAGIAANVWQFTTKTGGPANPTNEVVAADGSGDFLTVQGAVDAVAANNTIPTVINIRNGTYEEIVDIRAKNNLLLRGQSRSGAMVGYPNNAHLQSSTHFRMAFKVNANDISLDNMTVTNMTPVGGSQAEALMLESNVKRFICNNSIIGSYQDSLLANGSVGALGYFNNDLIEGQFDFIWGGGDLFFTNCEIRTLLGAGGAVSGGNATAARTDNGVTGNWPGYYGLLSSNGFSFVSCQFTRSTNTIVGTTLADSNGSTNGNVSWINCSFDANYIIPAAGVLNSQLLWEYGNSNLANTAPITFGLAVGDSAPALTATDPRYLAADNPTIWLSGWVPQLAPNILTNPASQSVSGGGTAIFTVTATGLGVPTYQWLFNGSPISGQIGSSLTISGANANNAGAYSVIVSNSAGVMVSSSAALAVGNTAPALAPVPNQTVNVGAYVSVANVATDPDVPAQTLTFSLLTGPASSVVDASGNFTWRPAISFAGTSNPVQVAVTDSGTPPLSATNSFNVIVNPLTPPVASALAYAGGLFSVSVTGEAGPDYELQSTTNLVGGIWVDVAAANSPASPFTLTDTNAATQPVQFYRIVTGPPLP
jgi:hypothetical protein